MAKRSQFFTSVCNSSGAALSGVECTVYDVGTLDESVIYSQRSGGSSTPSSFTTPASGRVSFWANPGAYDVTFHDPLGRVSDYTITWDSLSGDDAGIDGDRIEDSGLGAIQLAANSVGYDEQIAPTIITGTLSSDVELLVTDDWENGPFITLNQGAGVYAIWGSIEIANLTSFGGLDLELRSRSAIVFGAVLEQKRGQHYIGSQPGIRVTHSYFDILTTASDNVSVILQASSNIAGASSTFIESDRGFIKGYRIA